jgi:adenylate kinase
MSDDPVAVARQLMADVWPQLEAACAGKPPILPRQLILLNGAPGAGKGTNARTIRLIMHVDAPSVVVSDLLSSPEFVRIKNSGGLVGDKDVIGLLLKQLLEPKYAAGAIIDGFPRSRPQAEFLRLLVAKMDELAKANPGVCPTPSLHIVVLKVPEDIAVERQLKRGRETVASNEQARRLGAGIQPIRATDVDPAAAARRVRIFQEQTIGALESLQNAFPCNFVDASMDMPTVAQAIEKALR